MDNLARSNIDRVTEIINVSTVVIVFVTSLLLSPVISDVFYIPKSFVLLVSFSLFFLLFSLKCLKEKRIAFIRSKLDIPILLILIVTAVSVGVSTSKLNAIFGAYSSFYPSFATIVLGIIGFYSFSRLINEKILSNIVTALFFGFNLPVIYLLLETADVFPVAKVNLGTTDLTEVGIVTVITTILLNTVLLEHRNKVLKTITTVMPVLALTPLLIFRQPVVATLLLFGAIVGTIFGKNKKDWLLPLAVGLFIISLFQPLNEETFGLKDDYSKEKLGLRGSLAIAEKTINNGSIFGGGIGNFQQYLKTTGIKTGGNGTTANTFSDVFNFPLSVVINTGLFGLLTLLIFAWKVVEILRTGENIDPLVSGLKISVYCLLAALMFSPLSPSLFYIGVLVFSAVIYLNKTSENRTAEILEIGILTISRTTDSNIETTQETLVMGVRQPLTIPLFLVSIAIIAFQIVAIPTFALAENYYQKSISAISKDNGIEAYKNIKLAVSFNPYFDTYQRTLSQVAFGVIVNVLSRNSVSEKERQAATELLKEALKYTRSSVEIGSSNSQNWLVRGQIYQNLIGTAKNADVWAEEAYLKVIALDPTNPEAFIFLGDVLASQGRFEESLSYIKRGVELSENKNVGRYKVAQVLEKSGKITEATTEYSNVLSFLEKESLEYIKVKQKITDLENNITTERKMVAGPLSDGLGAVLESSVSAEASASTEQLRNLQPTY